MNPLFRVGLDVLSRCGGSMSFSPNSEQRVFCVHRPAMMKVASPSCYTGRFDRWEKGPLSQTDIYLKAMNECAEANLKLEMRL